MKDPFAKLFGDSEKEVENDPTIVVIVFRHNETLVKFQQTFLTGYSQQISDTHLFNYNHVERKGTGVDLYCCLQNEEVPGLTYLRSFLNNDDDKNKNKKIKCLLLLDWSIYDQQTWLRCLNNTKDSMSLVTKLEIEYTIICLNSQHIYSLQRNTTTWHASHIDFVQQSLRLFCMRKGICLLYIDTSKQNESSKDELLNKTILNLFTKEDIEMANPTGICIPRSCDNLQFIKTLNEKFNEEDATIENFESVVPKPILLNSHVTIQKFSKEDMKTEETAIVDDQAMLKNLYDYSRALPPQ